MKIKRLTIRNIASIEKGDIDFENGLIDRETCNVASLFLITGDTGSGKTVILDCISMALYGTTPRVKGVNGVNNNFYKNNDGTEISVGDITQYTRIGISWRDECFSELTFTGNDGIDYVARYSLGITNRRKYRDPEWKLTIAGSEILERKGEIKKRIQAAVGLTFEQFSRMAMLAQGQFAEFLTGKKEERERILEQLTATDIFSHYGTAISNIFKQTKQDKETSEKIYKEFSNKILSEEIHLELQKELEEKIADSSKVRSEEEKLRLRISNTEALITAERSIATLKIEEANLKAAEDSPEFRRRKALISLWDETAHQRECLSDKIKTSEKIDEDIKKLRTMKTEFNALRSDLSDRKEMAAVTSEILDKERLWIESREPLRKVFSEAKVIVFKIDSLSNLDKEMNLKGNESKVISQAIEGLIKEIAERENDVKAKTIVCKECQEKINRKSSERTALNPEILRKESTRLLNRMHRLRDLASRLAKADSEKADMEKILKETMATATQYTELKEKSDQVTSDCARAEREMKDAEERYLTMHLSLSKNFMELRKKLSDENATNCPLCGQSIAEHVHEWSSESYFNGILSPLEEERKRLSEKYTAVKKEADVFVIEVNKLEGSLKEKQKDLKKRKASLVKSEEDINTIVNQLEVAVNGNLASTLEAEISIVNKEIEKNSGELSRADELQKEIEALMKQKQPLDRALRDSEKKLQKSNEDLTEKKTTVKNAEERIKNLKNETDLLRKQISELLKGYANDWEINPTATSECLKKDSEEYSERTARFSKDEETQRSLLKMLESLSDTESSLDIQLATIATEDSINSSDNLKSLKIDVLHKKWNNLLINTSSLAKSLADNETRIKTIDKELSVYYEATGKTEASLRQLLQAADEINTERSLQQKHRDEVKRVVTLLSEAIKLRDLNMKALEIEKSGEIGDVEEMRLSLEELVKLKEELTQRIGAINERLEADVKTRNESERQLADLESKTLRYEKWDKMNRYFGGTRFRTLVQSHILRPLLNNANLYLRQITDHYTLTCSDENEQLSILVLDRYHNNEPRSVTVLSGGERFMISLALSLALSAMNRPDLNIDILFIDEGFGTLDAKSLDMVMSTLRRLPEINGQTGRRVGVISHREELTEQIDCQIQLQRTGEGRSLIVIN